MKRIAVYFDYYAGWDISIIRKVYSGLIERGYEFELTTREQANYIFVGNEFYPIKKSKSQIVIALCSEAITPDFNIVDYAVSFDNILYEDRHLRIPSWIGCNNVNRALSKHENVNSDDSRREFCNFVYSNNKWANKYRMDFFEELSKYKRVDSGGKIRNNIGYRVDDKISFQNNYKFSIAIENTVKNGYISEKLIDAFAARTIPIYYGDPLVANTFNNRAFINLMEFNSIEEAVDHIKRIDQDEELYISMLKEPAIREDAIDAEYINNYEFIIDFFDNIFQEPLDKVGRTPFWEYGYEKEYLSSQKVARFMYYMPRRVARLFRYNLFGKKGPYFIGDLADF